jgi:hypothetical protein
MISKVVMNGIAFLLKLLVESEITKPSAVLVFLIFLIDEFFI